MGRESMNLRGQVFELDSSGKAGPDAMPSAIAIRGMTPTGDAGETFAITAGMARWKSPIDAGSTSYSAAAFYVSQAGPIDTNAWLVETLLARPDKTMNLLPGGSAPRSLSTVSPEARAEEGPMRVRSTAAPPIWPATRLNSPALIGSLGSPSGDPSTRSDSCRRAGGVLAGARYAVPRRSSRNRDHSR